MRVYTDECYKVETVKKYMRTLLTPQQKAIELSINPLADMYSADDAIIALNEQEFIENYHKQIKNYKMKVACKAASINSMDKSYKRFRKHFTPEDC